MNTAGTGLGGGRRPEQWCGLSSRPWALGLEHQIAHPAGLEAVESLFHLWGKRCWGKKALSVHHCYPDLIGPSTHPGGTPASPGGPKTHLLAMGPLPGGGAGEMPSECCLGGLEQTFTQFGRNKGLCRSWTPPGGYAGRGVDRVGTPREGEFPQFHFGAKRPK